MNKTGSRKKTTVGTVSESVLAYTAGQDVTLDLNLIQADCIGTAAHVTMLSAMKPPLIAKKDVPGVLRELRTIMADAENGKFRITLADQDVHLAVERRLTERLGDIGKRIHTCRSRNDQVAVDLRLYAKTKLQDIVAAATHLAELWLHFAQLHENVPMVGRTHMQPAMPSSVGLWASAWTESLLDDISLLMSAYELNDQSPLGSAASYGVPVQIDRQLTSDLLGFSKPVHNVLHANQMRGKLESIILSACSQVMLTLSRCAQDLVIFSMPEFAYFRLPEQYTTGSSIMPQKRNPDVMELLRAKAAKVQAYAHLVAEIVRAAPSGYNRDLQEAKAPFMEGMDITLSTLTVLAEMVPAIEVGEAALLRAFSPDVFATDQALEWVAGGMPFRDAYHKVKANLSILESVDPVKAIQLKSHWGAPAGLNWAEYEARMAGAWEWVEEERADFSAHVTKLFKPAGR